MAVDSVSSLATSGSSQTPNAFSSLSSDQFMKIMLTELSKQDPLKPNDTSALLQQMSSSRTIQSDVDLSTKLDALVAQNQMSSAGTLIGKTISGIDASNTRVTGVVASV